MNLTLSRWAIRFCFLALALIVAGSFAAEKRPKLKSADFQQVELFAAMKSGQIDVQFIPKDAKQANVLIHNKTDRPLSIKLPDAFAGVPVLAQMMGGMGGMGGGMGGMGGGMGGMGGGMGGGGQGLGGGMGGMGGGMMGGMGGMGGGMMGGMGGGGGFFNVAPDKVGKFSVNTVCLEHGKPDPTSRMKYEIRPIKSFTKDPRVIEVCRMVGRGEVPQNAAQAAAWNLSNGISWQELAVKDRFRSQFTGQAEKFFAPGEIELAARIVQTASTRAKEQPQDAEEPTSPSDTKSPGETRTPAAKLTQASAPQPALGGQ